MAKRKPPENFHIDIRAADLIPVIAALDQTKGLSTLQVMKFLKVRKSTLEGWRFIGCGPKYEDPGPRCILYPPPKLIEWLQERADAYEKRQQQKKRKRERTKKRDRQRKQEEKHGRPARPQPHQRETDHRSGG